MLGSWLGSPVGGLAGGADRGKTMGIDGIADNRFPLRGRRP